MIDRASLCSAQCAIDKAVLGERLAKELLAADLGVVPLAMLGQLPEDLSLEDGLAAVAQRVAERVTLDAQRPTE